MSALRAFERTCLFGLAVSFGWVVSCGEGASPDPSPITEVLRHDLDPISLGLGEEIVELCYSWTLGNEAPLYINKVRMQGTLGIHHSNWFYVDEDTFDGPDGPWNCPERGFETVQAAVAGGVLFAQSTQAPEEVQEFEPGAVLVLPPRTRVVVDLHLINIYGDDLETEISLELHAIAAEDVRTPLRGFALEYFALEIPPQTRSEFSTACNFDNHHQHEWGRPLDFRIHYVLPHYHDLGDLLRLEAAGGTRDGERIWETRSTIGEPLGGRLDPPFDLTGATGLRLTCGFDNPRDEVVGWGVGDQEMCVAFGFTDSPALWAGSARFGTEYVGEAEGTELYQAGCIAIYAFPGEN